MAICEAGNNNDEKLYLALFSEQLYQEVLDKFSRILYDLFPRLRSKPSVQIEDFIYFNISIILEHGDKVIKYKINDIETGDVTEVYLDIAYKDYNARGGYKETREKTMIPFVKEAGLWKVDDVFER